jgi:RNA polymerase sigma-70 factor (ECF subfamily)
VKDEILVARLREGDEAAFEEIVRLYGARLRQVALRILRCEEDAGDAVQDAFVSAFQSIRSFQGTSRISTWLHRIVVNAALMRLRSRARRPEEPLDDSGQALARAAAGAEPIPLWRRSPDDAIEREQVRALVRRAIDSLPDTHRSVLILRELDELGTGEAARALGVSANAVKIRLHRARRALRALIEPQLAAIA